MPNFDKDHFFVKVPFVSAILYRNPSYVQEKCLLNILWTPRLRCFYIPYKLNDTPRTINLSRAPRNRSNVGKLTSAICCDASIQMCGTGIPAARTTWTDKIKQITE